ncbi:CPBP family intramembrane metalloprotease [Corynebacterium diphtheriae bv. mitis]|uniref:CPBP family intramembrane glutamic endopeptidase n=1 Tax=Corynebacterium diphtheriae TaxID=1717 RepID=UPI00024695BB|nr:CPBP family intramembrane glutamic endopeptidase [Corynebacterium diphtheriae]AEX82147.1 putative integral membrane protein [Corynebacterium diphtheriae HC04]MBG9248574.1 CPBP family intramembrane metalloprotease [Corynebacterium diphtheriae bv. gravis]MBG9338986.1 CPBP family intramembrane metalloprotease [Corynebacterium diphtheriae bv. mitis]MBG9342983.1 CPBP family intramembrane metalloprotease [Corynebacterium diphtheriae]MBG9359350.1 CPBP family intramembrane metalloprotease [Coryneba
MSTRRLRYEVALVLALTFGMAGLRSIFTLIDALSTPLNTQSVTLNAPRATAAWLDFALQLCGAATIMTWGLLALFLLGERLEKPRGADFSWGVGLAALIGIPGLGFYYAAVHLGLSKEVIPSTLEHFWTIPVLLLFSFAHAFAEEIVVVKWLSTRLNQLGHGLIFTLVVSALLRGSYHLYQGVSAGIGNVIMGLIYGWFYLRYRPTSIWPLIIGHFLIDAVAFVGYTLATMLNINVSW